MPKSESESEHRIETLQGLRFNGFLFGVAYALKSVAAQLKAGKAQTGMGVWNVLNEILAEAQAQDKAAMERRMAEAEKILEADGETTH